MSEQRLYIVYGAGNDAVGLVGRITNPIAEVKGNIVDLRQDVMHGLFTVFLVVDLGAAQVRIDAFRELIKRIEEDTGLKLQVDKYNPQARNPEKRNLLMVLVGRDSPGIIASISRMIAEYRVNIEFSDMVAREDVFLMELMLDISHASLPLENLEKMLQANMAQLGIQTAFQREDVFNKNKRVLLFKSVFSFISNHEMREILQQVGIDVDDMIQSYQPDDVPGSLQRAARAIDGMPLEVLHSLLDSVTISADTLELIQTLKIMGYSIVLASCSFAFVTDMLEERLGLDHSFGFPLASDDDAKSVVGELAEVDPLPLERERLVSLVATLDGVEMDDVTVISDPPDINAAAGLRLELDMKRLLDYYNQKVLSKDALLGLLGSFGIPRLDHQETNKGGRV